MKISHSLLLIPFLLLFFSCVSEICEATVSVNIKNGLGQNMSLTLHCKSKDNDLGVQFLTYGQTFVFWFKRNIWGTTLFFCSFQWDQSGLYWYDIVDPSHVLEYDCNLCLWLITTGGPCFYNPITAQYDKCKSWNKN